MKRKLGYGTQEVKGKIRYYKIKGNLDDILPSFQVWRINLKKLNSLKKTARVFSMQKEVDAYFEWLRNLQDIKPVDIIKSPEFEKVGEIKPKGLW